VFFVELPPQEFTPQVPVYHDPPTAAAKSQLGEQHSWAFVVDKRAVEGLAWISILAGKERVPWIANAICLILKLATPFGLGRPTFNAPEADPHPKFVELKP
jgi:hypothetical protein